MSFLFRWLFAFLLVALTFNPTQYNYVSWSMTHFQDQMPMVFLLGLLLLVGYVIYLRATLRSIGAFGMFLVLALVGAMVWVAYDYGWLTIKDTNALVWLGIFATSIVLGIGLSWSFIRRALSGQLDVDDADS